METPAIVASSVTTAAVGTHPTGMHSCLQHKDKMPISQTFSNFLTDQFELNVTGHFEFLFSRGPGIRIK